MASLKLKNTEQTEFTVTHEDGVGAITMTSKELSKLKTVDTISGLRSLTEAPETLWVSGYHVKDDGAFGSNIFRWNATSVEDDNGGTIIKLDSVATGRYELQYNGAVNVKWFGAVGYESSLEAISGNDSSISFIGAIASGNSVYIPNGYYLAENKILIDNNVLALQGESMYGANIVACNNFPDDAILAIEGVSHIHIENLTLRGNSTNNTGSTSAGLKLYDTYYSSVKQLTVRDTLGYGYYVTNANNNTFETCQTMTTFSYGWYIGNDDAKNNILIGCGAENFVDYGMYIRGVNTQVISAWIENYGSTSDCVGIHVHNRENTIYSPEVRGNTETNLLVGIEFADTFSDRSSLFGGSCYFSDTAVSVGANADYISLYGWSADAVSDGGNNTLLQKGDTFKNIDTTALKIEQDYPSIQGVTTNSYSRFSIGVTGATNSGDPFAVYIESVKKLQILKSAWYSALCPGADNTQNLGYGSFRWREIYSANGIISTSDAREKTFLDTSEKEILVAKELKGLMKKFKWNSSIEEKGDNARIHFGTSAQEVKSTFEKHGLAAEDYALLCYDEWEQELDEDGTITQEAGNRYGIRYEELLCFIIGAM